MPISASPWTNDYRIYTVRYFPDSNTSETVISGISSADIQANTDVLKEVTAGELYPEAAVFQTLRPVGSFTSFNLEQLLDTEGPGINAGPKNCIHSVTNPGVEFYFEKRACAGPETTGTDVHLKYTIGEGIIVPTSLNVDHRGNATLSYDLYASSDAAGADPIVKDHIDGNALPTLADGSLRWTMDYMTVHGIEVYGKRNISIAFSPTVTQEGADSDPADSVTSLDTMMPRVTISGVDPNWLSDTDAAAANLGVASLRGASVVAADTVLWFRERTTETPETDNNWISLAFNGLLTWDTIATGDPRSPTQTVMAIDVIKPSTGDPIAVAINQTDPNAAP